jgi:acetyl-CoA carboxylase, biotin carboxylase subunit
MFKKILVANRGEIAVRVIRSARELGISTVAVFSEPDRDSLHVKMADEAICIGPASSAGSYLNITRLISACEIVNADAVHPGYGFLSESSRFAAACEDSGLTFIGPPSQVIRKVGDKSAAKDSMKSAGVPVIPGSDGPVATPAEARRLADEIGYPVLLKAREGGGGKGMRMVYSGDDVVSAFQMASGEALAAFGNGDLYLEKFINNPRHIEIQFAGDKYGNVVHFFERDCSVQRRHQKLIEESPSPALTQERRVALGAHAVSGAKMIGYQNAGTMEFLLDETGQFYFMEVNARLQVEHPVTELVTGWDLVKLQIELAGGAKMPISQEEIPLNGWAMECRINAEDVEHNFRPCPGTVSHFHAPGGFGVRMDTHVYSDYQISPYYDSLLGKLIVHGRTREEAINRMSRALSELLIEGVKTTVPFHQIVMEDPVFRSGDFNTSYVETLLSGDRPSAPPLVESSVSS